MFYDFIYFGQGVPNETKGMINLNSWNKSMQTTNFDEKFTVFKTQGSKIWNAISLNLCSFYIICPELPLILLPISHTDLSLPYIISQIAIIYLLWRLSEPTIGANEIITDKMYDLLFL